MRYLQLFSIALFVVAVLFSAWSGVQYYGELNTDMPRITAEEEVLELSVKDPAEEMLRGLTAWDDTDGDLTGEIMVASVSHFLEPATVSVRYVVFDRHNHAASLTRRVRYTDYTGPEFHLDISPVYTVGTSCDIMSHIRVEDCLDGDISGQVRVLSNTVNTYVAGIYPMVLEVTNSCGDKAQVTVWITYQSKKNTANIHLSDYITYTPQGESFDPMDLVLSVTDQNGVALERDKLEILGNLDVNTPGAYALTYSIADGKLTGQSTLTVVVTERQA